MTAASLQDRTSPSGSTLTREEMAVATRALNRRRLTAFALVMPLLAFIGFAFVAPITAMLHQGVYNPTVAELIPDTLARLQDWDGRGTPDDAVLATMAVDLKRLANDRTAGKLAEELNRGLPGTSSIVKATARKLRNVADHDLPSVGAALLLEANDRWSSPELWRTVRESGKRYSERNFLTALDLERSPDGEIQRRESARIYIQLYVKTIKMALIITFLTFLLGYPLAYMMANSSPKIANTMLIFILLPFWTSLLVRTTSWIALLQTNGVINSLLMGVGITTQPIEMMYTEFATIVAMTHVLLPFMVLPLYRVMKGIDPSLMRASLSLGGAADSVVPEGLLPDDAFGPVGRWALGLHHLGRLLHHARAGRRNGRPDDFQRDRVPHAAVQQLGTRGGTRHAAPRRDRLSLLGL